MATIDNKWGQGVIYAAGIDLAAQKPLDSRIAVQTYAEMEEHVAGNRAYEGMQVFVVDDNKTYIYKNSKWETLIDSTDLVNDLTTGGVDKVLSAEQGKELKNQLDAVAGGTLEVPVATTEKIGGIKSGSAAVVGEVVVDGDGKATVSKVAEAGKLSTAQTIELTGGATGSTTFDGSGAASIAVTVDGTQHEHDIEKITGLQAALDAKAPINSPAFTGEPTSTTASQGDNSTKIATTAFVKTEIDAVLKAANAMEFKGTANSAEALPTSAEVGDVYVATAVFQVGAETVENGDMIICSQNGGENPVWKVVQSNIDGAVTGPESATDANLVAFNGGTGKVVKDSNITVASVSDIVANAVKTATIEKVGDEEAEVVTVAGNAATIKIKEYALKSSLEAYKASNDAAVAKKANKVDGTADNIAALAEDGQFKDSGIAANTIATKDEVTAVDDKVKGLTYVNKVTAGEVSITPAAGGSDIKFVGTGAATVTADAGSKTITINVPAQAAAKKLTLNVGTETYEYDTTAEKTVQIDASTVGATKAFTATSGNLLKAGADNTVEDAGFVLPAPDGAAQNKFLISNTGTYSLGTIGLADVTGLNSALDNKVETSVVTELRIFSKIKIGEGENYVTPTSNNDGTLQFKGDGLTLSSEGNVVTFKVNTYKDATQSESGLMSAADKTKLDGFGQSGDYWKKAELPKATDEEIRAIFSPQP